MIGKGKGLWAWQRFEAFSGASVVRTKWIHVKLDPVSCFPAFNELFFLVQEEDKTLFGCGSRELHDHFEV